MFAYGLSPIDNTADVIDSREVIARIEWLDSARQMVEDGIAESSDFTEDEAAELNALREFAREGENNADDWLHGATLIRETYFTDYAREYVSEIYGESVGNVPDWVVIDWQATADNLATDYNEVTFGDVTYYVR